MRSCACMQNTHLEMLHCMGMVHARPPHTYELSGCLCFPFLQSLEEL